MDKCREEFETKFGVVGTRMPNGNYSSWAHQAKWDAFQAAWQHQQAKVDLLKGQLIKLGFSDKGGQLMKPPLGTAPIFELLDERPLCKKRARNLSHGESWSFILLILWLFLIAGIGLFYLFRWLV